MSVCIVVFPREAVQSSRVQEQGATGPVGRLEPGLPQVFGRYLLMQRLSRGGMGELYLAKHGLAGFEKLVVIKKVLTHLASDEQFISRFVDEAQLAIKLHHVNIAQVFEVGRVGDEYFLALEYCEGRDLRRTFSTLRKVNGRFPLDLALFVGREIANGLAYAHRRADVEGRALNLVHCDISPPNILVSFEGETKIIDFGIAKSAIKGTATDPKIGFGKFGYMAPEQLIRGGVVDHRTDIYAAGVVLFELLTGQRLYEFTGTPDFRALARAVAKGDHKLPSDLDPDLAPFDDLVLTALRPNADERYQSAAEFRDVLAGRLAALNPTISTEVLGGFMQRLFADEMAAQRELNERVANTHLTDFEQAFSTQASSTVSFAAVAPLASVVARGPSQDTVVPMPPDGTAAQPAMLFRLRSVLLGAVVAMAAGIGLAIWSLRDGWGPEGGVASAGRFDAATIAVPSDEPRGETAGADAAVLADVVVDAPAAIAPAGTLADARGQENPEPPRSAVMVRKKPSLPTVDTKPKLPKMTREQLNGRFAAAVKEYAFYKKKYGQRLEREWGDLATFMQYVSTDKFEDAGKRIDTFRQLLRKESD